ncbi:hypothetical protein CEUSTIGMA_g6302.t1, partial [Chlamydomonas eustigma]
MCASHTSTLEAGASMSVMGKGGAKITKPQQLMAPKLYAELLPQYEKGKRVDFRGMAGAFNSAFTTQVMPGTPGTPLSCQAHTWYSIVMPGTPGTPLSCQAHL